MKGSLYKITNLVNSKIYIGKTYVELKDRWKLHKYDALREDRPNKTKFQNAIRKYGPENFKIELIAQFEEGELEQKEIEYIQKYDSYKNGYNSTLGGDGYKIDTLDEQLIISMYKNGMSISMIMLELGLGTGRQVSKILKDAGFVISRQTKVYVEQYDLYGNLLNTFESKMDAWKWLVENYRDNMKKNTAYYYIKQSSEQGNTAFGYKWKQYETEIIAENDGLVNNKLYYCNVYDDNMNIVYENILVQDMAKYLVDNGFTGSKSVRYVAQTIKQHHKNHIYGYYWEVFSVQTR